MNKVFVIGLPRTGTTSISVTLLEYFKVAHTGYTKRTFELADVISDCPCFCDYQQLDMLFPDSKFVYLDRNLATWVPSITMLLTKMLPIFDNKTYVSPILERCFTHTFKLSCIDNPINVHHLVNCYKEHQYEVLNYFKGTDKLLSIDIAEAGSLSELIAFVGLSVSHNNEFPRYNTGKRVDHWKEVKHNNKVNSNLAGKEGRKYFMF